MEKKDFDLYPLKLKALDSASGTKAPQTLEHKAETTDNQSFTIPGRILWDHSHYTVTPHALLHFHFRPFVTIAASNDSAR
jgi:hypothetical protein